MNPERIWLIIEFILLFFGVPLFIVFCSGIIHPSMLVLPVIGAIFFYLNKQPDFSFKDLLKLNVTNKVLFNHLVLFIITTVVLLLAVFFLDRDNLFNLPKGNLKIWLAMCVFYPIFSAFGQEIIYRLFLIKRYKPLFKSDIAIILASSITFSFVHIVYFSVISIVLTFLLGYYLAYTYLSSKSTLLVALLHGLYGNLIFTVGLGGYFWLDMYKWL